MASEEARTEWKKIKKARGSQTGSLTKLHNKLQRHHAEEISSYDIRVLERARATIAKAEAAFQQTVEDAAEIIDVDTDKEQVTADETAEEADKATELRDLKSDRVHFAYGSDGRSFFVEYS